MGRQGLWARASRLGTRLLLSAEKVVSLGGTRSLFVFLVVAVLTMNELPRGGTRQEMGGTGGNVHTRSGSMARAEAGGQSEYLEQQQQQQQVRLEGDGTHSAVTGEGMENGEWKQTIVNGSGTGGLGNLCV